MRCVFETHGVPKDSHIELEVRGRNALLSSLTILLQKPDHFHFGELCQLFVLPGLIIRAGRVERLIGFLSVRERERLSQKLQLITSQKYLLMPRYAERVVRRHCCSKPSLMLGLRNRGGSSIAIGGAGFRPPLPGSEASTSGSSQLYASLLGPLLISFIILPTCVLSCRCFCVSAGRSVKAGSWSLKWNTCKANMLPENENNAARDFFLALDTECRGQVQSLNLAGT